MDENKHFRCSFCGKTEQEVDKLLSGPGYISVTNV